MTELSQTWPCFSLGSTQTPKHAVNWPKVCTSWHMHMHTRSSALLKFWWEGGKKGCRVLSSQVGQAEKRPQHEVKKKVTWKKERRQQIFAFFNSTFRWVDNHKHYTSVNAEQSLKKYKPCHCQVKEEKIYLRTWCESASILSLVRGRRCTENDSQIMASIWEVKGLWSVN